MEGVWDPFRVSLPSAEADPDCVQTTHWLKNQYSKANRYRIYLVILLSSDSFTVARK